MQALETQIKPYYETQRFTLFCGDCRSVLPTLEDCSVDSIVTDPPYELGFMGKGWDRSGIAYAVEVWRECLRVLKPGGHLLAFGGSRTYHRLACAIEDAGFEIRDQVMWIYGQGFPKSKDVSKAIDEYFGVERGEGVDGPFMSRRPQERVETTIGAFSGTMGARASALVTSPATWAAKHWNGYGTALKPAHEPAVLARKPIVGSVAENVLIHGTGGLNIDGCRIEMSPEDANAIRNMGGFGKAAYERQPGIALELSVTPMPCKDAEPHQQGRWPANVILSYPEDEYVLRSNVTPEQKKELFKWLYENA